jgi:hypothetical protein
MIVLPGPHTPGAYNRAVTQQTIQQTVCVHGYTRTIRPPESYTTDLKQQQINHRHLPGDTRDYEEDHMVPLALGGAPYAHSNLWPQPWDQARADDVLEFKLYLKVCDGKMRLKEAQGYIVRWKRTHG